MKLIQTFLFLIISFFSFANTNVYHGDIAGRKIKLYVDDTHSPELDVFFLFEDDPLQVPISLILDYNNTVYFDELDNWVLYDKSCYGEKKLCSFMKLSGIELNDDLQTIKNNNLAGYWFNASTNKKSAVSLQRDININFDEDSEFNNVELLQMQSLENIYFTAVLSKKKNELLNVTGINIYSKKNRFLIQNIDNLNYAYNSFYSVELGDYNFDGILDLAISKGIASSMYNKEYDYYINENNKFIKLPLSGFNFIFDKKNKLATSTKICETQKENGQKIITTISDVYSFHDKKFTHVDNSCKVDNEQLSQNTECSKFDYDKCYNQKSN